MKRNNFLILLLVLILANVGYSQNNTSEILPERIMLNLTAEPSKSMAVTWRTSSEVMDPLVQIAEAGVWSNFSEKSRSIIAKTERVYLDNEKFVYYHSVVIDGLKPAALYAYRVGGDSVWSEWNQFTTAGDKTDPVKFVSFGDPQDGIKEYCSRVFREAFKKVPDANFWLFTGDITTEPTDKLWDEFYYAGGFIFKMVPTIMAPGNHDNMYKMENGKIVLNKKGKKERTKALSPMWRGQFTFPENGPAGFEESTYYVDYQGIRFIMINSNDKLKEQAVWLDSILSNNPNRWTIVSFHHPLYSTGRERDDRTTRDAFLGIFDKYNVDLVLTGHDHSYARSYKLKNGVKVNNSERGTVYVLSVSGPKSYSVSSIYADLMAKIGGNVQLFQAISIDGNKLSYNSYTATGSLYDSFELTK